MRESPASPAPALPCAPPVPAHFGRDPGRDFWKLCCFSVVEPEENVCSFHEKYLIPLSV